MINMNIKRGLPIGGQALPNGVMMRTQEKYAIALRLRSGRIVTDSWPSNQKKIIRKPLLRGIYQLGVSFKASVQAVLRAMRLSKNSGEMRISPFSLISAAAAVLLLLFYALATDTLYGYVYELIYNMTQPYLFTFVYGIADLILFFVTLILIACLPAVRKLLRYHGAEHKAIACYEKGLEMTIENVRAQSRFHKRCGTSMMVSIFLAVLIASVFMPPQLPEAIQEALLIAVILMTAGLSYEAMRAPKTTLPTYLGLMAQRLTTHEPDDAALECAISAVIKAAKF